jgi:hypothetical protein
VFKLQQLLHFAYIGRITSGFIKFLAARNEGRFSLKGHCLDSWHGLCYPVNGLSLFRRADQPACRSTGHEWAVGLKIAPILVAAHRFAK